MDPSRFTGSVITDSLAITGSTSYFALVDALVRRMADWHLNFNQLAPGKHKTMKQCWFNVGPAWQREGPQKTRDINPLLAQCWSTVYDAGPTLTKQWVNILFLFGHSVSIA